MNKALILILLFLSSSIFGQKPYGINFIDQIDSIDVVGIKTLKSFNNKVAISFYYFDFSKKRNLSGFQTGITILDDLNSKDDKIHSVPGLTIFENSLINDNKWYQGLVSSTEEGIKKINLYEIDSNLNIENKFEYISKYGTETYNLNVHKIIYERSINSYYILASIFRYNAHRQLMIIKLNNKFEEVWIKYYRHLSFAHSPETSSYSSGNYLRVWTTIHNLTYSPDDKIIQMGLLTLNHDGDVISYPESDKDRAINFNFSDSHYRSLSQSDGTYLMSIGIDSVVFKSGGNPNTESFYFRNSIAKVDSNLNIIWNKPVVSTGSALFDLRILSFELDPRDSQYLVLGNIKVFNEKREFRDISRVAKINSEAETLWERNFEFDFFGDTLSDFRGARIIPYENGYLLGGQVIANQSAPHDTIFGRQNGVLIYLDSLGCAIPGCHEVLSNVESSNIKNETSLKVFPNPSNDILSLIFNGRLDKKYSIQIKNLQGISIENKDVTPNTTNIIRYNSDVQPGTYFLMLLEEGRLIKTKQIIINR